MRRLIIALALLALAAPPLTAYGAGMDGLLTHVTVQRSVDDTLLWVSRSGVSDSLLWVCRYCIPTSPTSYDFGFIEENGYSASGLDYFTVTNYGEEPIDIAVRGTDLAGDVTWTLSDDGNNGAGVYALEAGLDGGAYDIVVKKTSPYNDLVSSLGAGSAQSWGLQMQAPTTIEDKSAKAGAVTLTASISG